MGFHSSLLYTGWFAGLYRTSEPASVIHRVNNFAPGGSEALIGLKINRLTSRKADSTLSRDMGQMIHNYKRVVKRARVHDFKRVWVKG